MALFEAQPINWIYWNLQYFLCTQWSASDLTTSKGMKQLSDAIGNELRTDIKIQLPYWSSLGNRDTHRLKFLLSSFCQFRQIQAAKKMYKTNKQINKIIFVNSVEDKESQGIKILIRVHGHGQSQKFYSPTESVREL